MSQSLLDLHKSVLEYLDQTHGLASVRQKCELYIATPHKAFHFEIRVDPSDMIDFDSHLGNLVLNRVSVANKIFQEVVFTAIECLGLLPQCISTSQVVICLRLRALPDLPGYTITTSSRLMAFTETRRFLQYEGTVCAMSTPHKYTRSARYVCPDPRCDGATENRYIRLHIPGAREKQTIRKDFACTICGEQLVEDVACRELGDKLTVEIIDLDVCPGLRHRQQIMTAILRDDLVRSVHMGGRYKFIGQVIYDRELGIVFMDVNNINPVQENLPRQGPPICQLNLSQLPDAIHQIYQDRKGSSWSFALSLAYAFGGCICPCGTYLHVKLGMLLSIVGTFATKESRSLDLLVIGSDTLVLGRLLRYGANFANKTVIHTAGKHLTAATGKRRHGPVSTIIEGGSLLLARNGLCLLPDLNSFKKSTKQVLQRALDQGGVFVSDPSLETGAAAVRQTFLPMSCKVWAHMDPGPLKPSQNWEDLTQQAEMGGTSKELASMFGMVYYADMPVDAYVDYLSVHHKLLAAMGAEPVAIIPDHDFKKFLEVARAQDPQFLSTAENLIKGYYIASRHVRATGAKTTVIPQSAIKTITSLARSHAQLSLRTEVVEDDAVMAILLYEESMTFLHGHSLLHVKPLQHIADNDIQNYIGKERDIYISMFHQQLKNFIELHAQEDAFMEE